MQSTLSVIIAAKDVALITTYAAKLGLNLSSSTTFVDEQIENLINWASGEIATYCDRVFAKETVRETFRDFDADADRIFLARYPVINIESVIQDGTALEVDVDYEIELSTGKLLRLGGAWAEPTEVTYTGGYDLPFESPLALQQACILMAREAYYASTRGDSTIRMVSHKSARVIYFDPNAKGGGAAAGGGGSPARRAASDLLRHYMRVQA